MLSVVRFLAIAAVAVFLLVIASGIVVRRTAAWIRGTTAFAQQLRASSSRQRWTERAVLLAGAVVALSLVDAAIEPYRPIVEHVAITDSRLAAGQTVRIVHLSDLHSEARAKLEDVLPDKVADLAPDVIAFTGDAVNHDDGVANFRRTMTSLARIAPVVAVRGNWDVWWFPHARLFEDTGARELKNEAVPIRVRGQEIWLVGIPVDFEAMAGRAFSGVPPGRPVVFLHHFPWAVKLAAARGAVLHLAGDTHGGQARLPWLGELLRIARHRVWRPLGLQREGGTWLYVSRGIGTEGNLPPLRLFCRPEITLIELRGP